MSFLKKLFGGGATENKAEESASQIEHNGFLIRATPMKQGNEYLLCGVISKEVDGVIKEHQFIRADRFPAMDTAIEITFQKGRKIIDEQGLRLFG
ncbi:MAG: HlyU family transcriptional regulator [Phyllobacterium sp.]